MATSTTNLGLTKPSVNDAADIGVLNSNFDKIDTKCNPALFAPAGYGLGENGGKTTTDYNACILGGVYNGNNAVNGPAFIANAPYSNVVVSRGASRIYQTMYCLGKIAHRHSNNGGSTWEEWVDISPSAFAPSGYGLGGQVPLTTADAAVQTGFYRVWLEKVLGYTGYVNLMVMNNNDQVISQTAFGVNNRVLFRVYYNTWGDWVDLSPSAFAPSGCGYGDGVSYIGAEAGQSYTDKIDALVASWPNMTAKQYATYDANQSTYAMLATIYKYSSQATLIVAPSFSGSIVTRKKESGVWRDWEWVNPPMATNVAYLTTERFTGKPVYAKAVYVGTLPNNSTKTVDGVIESGIYNLVSLEGKFYNSGDTYTFTNNENIHLSLGVEQPYAWLNIQTKADFSSYSGFVVIKWTRP